MNGEVIGVNNMYEYVERSEYQPVREQLEGITHKVQDLLRTEFTFQYRLIGSGGRHLITRVKGGNQGYDFDYNLILNGPDGGKIWRPEFARPLIFEAFKEAIKGTPYNAIENKTPAISIKIVDRLNNRISHSCDFAVIYYPKNDNTLYYKYDRLNKASSTYTWEERELSRNVDDKKDWIIDNNHWAQLKDEYLKLKNTNNDLNKVSFSLYHEAVHNVYNWFNQEEEDEDDGWDD